MDSFLKMLSSQSSANVSHWLKLSWTHGERDCLLPLTEVERFLLDVCLQISGDTHHHFGTHFVVKMCFCGAFDAYHVKARFSKTGFQLVVLNLYSFYNDF